MTFRPLILVFLGALVLAALPGCNLIYKQNVQQGNAIEQEDLDALLKPAGSYLPEAERKKAEAAETVPAAPPPPAEPISVSINATPWATVEIDGEDYGVTPMAGILLAPGDHQFRVEMPDGSVLEETVPISSSNRHIAFPQ